MLLYWCIFLFVTFFAIKDWKKAVITWIPIRLLFNPCVCLKYTSPAVSLELAIAAIFVILYFTRERNKKIYNNRKFFFKKAFIAYLISYLLSIIFSIVPFATILTNTLKYFLEGFILLYLFQKALVNEIDIKLLIKTFAFVIILITLLGLYESIFGDNPWLDYVFINAPLDLIRGKMYYVPPFMNTTGELSTRYGMIRGYSFFNIHIAYGCTCVLIYFFFMYILKIQKEYQVKCHYIYILMLLGGILMCNSKTPYLGLIFFTFCFIRLKDVISPKTFIGVIFIVGIISVYFPSYLNNFYGLFDDKLAQDGGGSSVALRTIQFQIGLQMFEQNPLFGNGVGAIEFMMSNNAKYAGLLGSESSWLKILPERGIVGVMAYLILYYTIYNQLKGFISTKSVIFFLVGLMAMETATGFMDLALYGAFIITIYRLYFIKQSVNYKKYE